VAVVAPAAEVAPEGAVAAEVASSVAAVGFLEGAAASAALGATWAQDRASPAAAALRLPCKGDSSDRTDH
jgi:hypothetical protein